MGAGARPVLGGSRLAASEPPVLSMRGRRRRGRLVSRTMHYMAPFDVGRRLSGVRSTLLTENNQMKEENLNFEKENGHKKTQSLTHVTNTETWPVRRASGYLLSCFLLLSPVYFFYSRSQVLGCSLFSRIPMMCTVLTIIFSL